MKIAATPGDVLVTHALGSCLGITAYDPQTNIGGLLHVMLPASTINPEKARKQPFLFVDCGVPEFFRGLIACGAVKSRLVVKVAGGACVQSGGEDRFAIGKRNYLTLRKLFWQNGIFIAGEDIGGTEPRTMYLDISTGRVWLNMCGVEKEL
ncbi:MAG: chemotaxis protein CheD [Phycisphaerae bacterium]|nr:chemotaxis protein CheD [Phycisphaerae bacterium]